jgi:hypothetical protein
MTYKMQLTGLEGLLTAMGLIALPFVILAVMLRLLPTRRLDEQSVKPA